MNKSEEFMLVESAKRRIARLEDLVLEVQRGAALLAINLREEWPADDSAIADYADELMVASATVRDLYDRIAPAKAHLF